MEPTVRRASLPAPRTTEEDLYRTHTPQIRRRWDRGQDVQVVTRGNQRLEIHHGLPTSRNRTPLILLLGAVSMLLLLLAWNALSTWWNRLQDNIHYGYPRVSQLDAVVGHNDSPTNQTHFVFLNLRGHVQIIEIPGGDASKERVFTGPTLIGAGQDMIPITGEIRSEDGRLDLIVHIQDQQIVYINDGSTFKEQQ